MKLLAAFALLAALPAAAQDLATALRGTWAAPGCANATEAVHVTARSIVQLSADAGQRLVRASRLAELSGWTLAVGDGAEQRRLLLRIEGDALAVAVPDPKLRDDRLPGDAVPARYVRCAEPPALLALHGEGIAFLHGLEAMEPVCLTGTVRACVEAFFAYADVARDGRLTPAEIGRALRGATWAVQMAEGADGGTLLAGFGGSALVGIVVAQTLVQTFDYDQSGSLSIEEIALDRLPAPLAPPPRSASAPPLPLATLAEQLGALRGTLERLPELMR